MLLPALLILYFTDLQAKIALPTFSSALFFVLILGIVGTGFANIIFYKLIQISSPVFASSVTFLIPIVAFLWGLFDNEIVLPLQLLGAFIILLGIYWANKK